jgi:polar amino acid transport system substrate-binding protein
VNVQALATIQHDLRFRGVNIYKLALENPGYGDGAARLPDREELFKWVGPVWPDDWVHWSRQRPTPPSLEDANNTTWVPIKGDAIAEYTFWEKIKNDAACVRNLKKLLAGRIDLWAANLTLQTLLQKQEGITRFKYARFRWRREAVSGAEQRMPDEVEVTSRTDTLRSEASLTIFQKNYL